MATGGRLETRSSRSPQSCPAQPRTEPAAELAWCLVVVGKEDEKRLLLVVLFAVQFPIPEVAAGALTDGGMRAGKNTAVSTARPSSSSPAPNIRDARDHRPPPALPGPPRQVGPKAAGLESRLRAALSPSPENPRSVMAQGGRLGPRQAR
ncbi:hypothetical protein P7K49_001713 [Saguinus oedipus]|uniref:Uncharacterized protein n=1 Tax=Saguinus oedipus TaxID=9490 RepID=A0ABQ9WF95_SAGOE|nr:hypothetical protein P7K49_001713 [Saguinus oedipus]